MVVVAVTMGVMIMGVMIVGVVIVGVAILSAHGGCFAEVGRPGNGSKVALAPRSTDR